jgi:antitoxin VapB
VALTIQDAEADRLARELAAQTGESLDTAVVIALRERLERERKHDSPAKKRPSEYFLETRETLARLAIHDSRSADEILGYGEDGLPR